ncbi:MAG: TRAP transporter small permease [bacterium]
MQAKTSRSGMVAKLEDGLLVLILVSMILLAFTEILLRNLLGIGLVWIEPLMRQMLLWVALLGAMVATREHNHISVDAIARFLSGRRRLAAAFMGDAFATVVCALMTYSTFLVFYQEFREPRLGFVVAGLPVWASLLTLPVAFCVMTLRFFRFTLLSLRKPQERASAEAGSEGGVGV